MQASTFGVIAVLVFAIIIYSSWASAPICPRCGGARTKRWQHSRKDGSADRRFTDNPLVCTRCGHHGPAVSRSEYRDQKVVTRTAISSSNVSVPTARSEVVSRRRWLAHGENLNIAGRNITCGSIYVIDAAKDQRPYNPSTIIRGLPVADGSLATPLGYWPNYYFLTQAQRGAYCDWLQGGRADPAIDIGYVFLYFYGLEWRTLVDETGLSEVSQDVLSLHAIYGANRSFRIYALNLLGAMLLKGRVKSLKPLMRVFTEHATGSVPPLLLDAVVWQHAGNALPLFWARQIAMNSGSFKKGVAIERLPERFEELLTQRFNEQFPNGIAIPAIEAPVNLPYRWALRGSPKEGLTLPTTGLLIGASGKSRDMATGPLWIGLRTVWDQVTREVSAEARRRSSSTTHTASESDLIALRVAATSQSGVPSRSAESLPENRTQRMTTVTVWYDDHTDEQGIAQTTLSALFALQFGPVLTTLTPTQQTSLIEEIERSGLAIEPDLRPNCRRVTQDEPRFLYRPAVAKRPSVRCQEMRPLVEAAVAIGLSDGELDPGEMEEIVSHIDQKHSLPEQDRVRLRIYAQWLVESKRVDHGFNRLRRIGLSAGQKKALAALAVAIVLRDGKVTETECTAIKRLYHVLDLPGTDLDAMLKPPADARSGVTIDWGAVARLQAETHEVQGLLAQALSGDGESGDEPEPALTMNPIPTAPSKTSPETAMASVPRAYPGLDPRASTILEVLVEHAEISAADFKSRCATVGLMPGAAIDLINEWSDEHLGDRCIDGDGPYRIAIHLLTNRI